MTDIVSPYIPAEFSVLFPDGMSGEFWDRCARRELAFQRCSSCGTFRHPPAAICYRCRSKDTEWVPVTGDGTVFSFTIVTHPVHPALAPLLPFNVSLVEFPDAPGVRLISNVVDASPEELSIDMPVRLHWDEVPGGPIMPRFVKAAG